MQKSEWTVEICTLACSWPHWKGSFLQNRASVDVIRPAATFHSSDATVVIGRRLSYPCPSRALFYNYAPLLPASSYFNSYLHGHVLLYRHVCHHGRNNLWIHNILVPIWTERKAKKIFKKYILFTWHRVATSADFNFAIFWAMGNIHPENRDNQFN